MSKRKENARPQPPKMHSFKLLGRLLSYLFHYYKIHSLLR